MRSAVRIPRSSGRRHRECRCRVRHLPADAALPAALHRLRAVALRLPLQVSATSTSRPKARRAGLQPRELHRCDPADCRQPAADPLHHGPTASSRPGLGTIFRLQCDPDRAAEGRREDLLRRLCRARRVLDRGRSSGIFRRRDHALRELQQFQGRRDEDPRDPSGAGASDRSENLWARTSRASSAAQRWQAVPPRFGVKKISVATGRRRGGVPARRGFAEGLPGGVSRPASAHDGLALDCWRGRAVSALHGCLLALRGSCRRRRLGTSLALDLRRDPCCWSPRCWPGYWREYGELAAQTGRWRLPAARCGRGPSSSYCGSASMRRGCRSSEASAIFPSVDADGGSNGRSRAALIGGRFAGAVDGRTLLALRFPDALVQNAHSSASTRSVSRPARDRLSTFVSYWRTPCGWPPPSPGWPMRGFIAHRPLWCR